MNFFAVGGEDGSGNKGKITVLDMPGYGKGSREEWGREVEKYLAGRRGYDFMLPFALDYSLGIGKVDADVYTMADSAVRSFL